VTGRNAPLPLAAFEVAELARSRPSHAPVQIAIGLVFALVVGVLAFGVACYFRSPS